MSCALGALLVCALAWSSPAAAAISVGDVQVAESGTATFTITRDASFLAGATTVAFTTVARSAGTSDYAGDSGTRSFESVLFATTQTRSVSIAIADDALDEPSESFALVISGAEVTDDRGVATIADNDPPPSLSVADAAPVQEGAGAKATFAVWLMPASGRAVAVAYTLQDESATAGQDYAARPGTLVIAAGATEAAIAVDVLDDAADEPSETFVLRLATPDGARLGDGQAAATIADDDEPPPPPSPPGAGPAPAPATSGGGQEPGTGTRPTTGSSVPSSGTTAARAGLGVSSPRLQRPSTVLVTISCPSAAGRCSGRVTIFSLPNPRSRVKALRKERRLGRVRFSVPGGRAQTLAMRLGRTDLALLRRAGRMKVRAYATTQDSAGRTGVRTVSGTLVARTAHSSPSGR